MPCDGYAVLFGRSIAAVIPDDLDPALSLSVMDVCGAPALTARVVGEYAARGHAPVVAVIGGAGKSGSLSLAAAREAGAAAHHRRRAPRGRARPARRTPASPTPSRSPTPATRSRCATPSPPPAGRPTSPSCASTSPGCEGGAILATAEGGTVIFFSMATSFSAAALGAEGLAADVRMLVGNGYVPGHAAYAMELLRGDAGVRGLFERRI